MKTKSHIEFVNETGTGKRVWVLLDIGTKPIRVLVPAGLGTSTGIDVKLRAGYEFFVPVQP